MDEHRSQGRTRPPEAPPAADDSAAPDRPGRHRTAEERLRAARRAARPAPGVGEPLPDPDSGEDETAERVERASRDEGLELVEKLAEGSGTRTWLARERSTRERFEVTFAVSTAPQRRTALETHFRGLARAWSAHEHPTLVGIRALLGDEGPACALVTAHVDARPLAELMRDTGRITPETLLPVLADAARGLAVLHDRGWVHGALAAQHVLVTPSGRGVLGGYGLRDAEPGTPGVWGPGDRSAVDETGPRTGTAAEDVRALAVTAWLALTGRHPGPGSHRVPLALLCPGAPRHLVLLLEAALSEEPAARPTAHELATGFEKPLPRTAPARRPPERMTPEVIRADGTVVRSRRLPALAGIRRSERASGMPVSTPRRDGRSALAARLQLSRGRRVLVAAVAVLVAALLAWGFSAWSDGGPALTAPGLSPAGSSTSSSLATDDPQAPAGSGRGGAVAGGAGGAASSSPAGDAAKEGSGTEGSEAEDAAEKPGAHAAGGGTTATGAATGAPGESMQDKERAAREAVSDLVARRAAALAAGDEAGAEAVYVPNSGLASRDRDLIRRAAAQASATDGGTRFSGLSMEVVDLTEQERPAELHLTPAEAGRSRTYEADVLTRGWHGDLPTGAAVTRTGAGGDEARQRLRITIVATAQGWRLADVTPVVDAG